MGKNHRKNHKKRSKKLRGWDSVIIPEWMPKCPMCERIRGVGQTADELCIFICQECNLDFVVMKDGECVPLDEISDYELDGGVDVIVGSPTYRVGEMVEVLSNG